MTDWIRLAAGLALGLITHGCATSTPSRVEMYDAAYPADADWENLPADVRDDLQSQNHSASSDGHEYEPPYPIGGMRAVMRRIRYPVRARRDGAEGRIVVIATVGADGVVESARAEPPLHPELDRAAVDALRKSPFRPGTRDGQPVRASVKVPFQFHLEPASASPWWWPFGR